MKKFRFFINFTREENWLNDMAKQGYHLTCKKGISYIFEKGHPEDVNIRVDYHKLNSSNDYDNYITLFEDSGWKHIAGMKSASSHYFKQMDTAKDNDIFSDAASKAGRYQRLSNMFITIIAIYTPLFAALVSTGVIPARVFINLKALYLTPGLWERSGEAFWNAFWFETPFALMRGILWMILPIVIILLGIFASESNSLYKKAVKNSENK
jgi:Protein of unknown function (DUF2812).